MSVRLAACCVDCLAPTKLFYISAPLTYIDDNATVKADLSSDGTYINLESLTLSPALLSQLREGVMAGYPAINSLPNIRSVNINLRVPSDQNLSAPTIEAKRVFWNQIERTSHLALCLLARICRGTMPDLRSIRMTVQVGNSRYWVVGPSLDTLLDLSTPPIFTNRESGYRLQLQEVGNA